MKIALVGYGNMGQELEKLALERNDEIVSVSFRKMTDKLDIAGVKKAEVALDFTSPEVVLKNMQAILPLGTKMVIGTTGWYDKLPAVKKMVAKYKAGLIYAKNFSVGANIFFKTVYFASKLFDKYGGYDVYGFEIHHKGKKDSPSGTAKKIAEIILSSTKEKKQLQAEKLDRKIRSDELHFASIRGGFNPGHHEVIFDSLADKIELSHSAHSRRGFAQGAFLAADFIKNNRGLFAFEDLFERGVI
ncbi:4-hydroxy-tetrahydrodipicolinate reductase [Candidatus Curtissbacteria bacterium]|nr:4-hydroxy-tetrahydrodipicolinate reductase [Candidatus Curtissbacteria bacterium]